jgi:LysM domain
LGVFLKNALYATLVDAHEKITFNSLKIAHICRVEKTLPHKNQNNMSLKDKYQPALDLAKSLDAKMENFHEENGELVFNGEVATPYERNLIWDKFKSINGLDKEAAAPAEIKANISVADSSVFHRHTVVSGDTLGKIAKHYLDNAADYKKIFEANRDILSDPDMIKVGQVLVIPAP